MMKRSLLLLALCAFLTPALAQNPRKLGNGTFLVQHYTSTDCAGTLTSLLEADDQGVTCWDTTLATLLVWDGAAWTTVGSGGSGDMAKSVYDADGDGTVDVAASATTAAGLVHEGPSYTVFNDGGTYKARAGTTGAIAYSGADPGAAIQTAITALATTGGQIVVAPGTYTYTSTVPEFPVNIPDWLTVSGYGAEIQLSAAAGRAFGITQGVSYDSVQNIRLEGFTVKGNQLVDRTAVIFGNYVNSTTTCLRHYFRNIHIRDIYAYDVKTDSRVNDSDWSSVTTYAAGAEARGSDWIPYRSLQDNNLNHNPPTSPTWWEPIAGGPMAHNGFIKIGIALQNPVDRQVPVTDIVIERVTMVGGNWGVLITGSNYNTDLTWIDRITIRDCIHDMRPAGAEIQDQFFYSTCFHVGSYGLVGSAFLDNLRCYAPGDNCVELNNAKNGVVRGLYCENPPSCGVTLSEYSNVPNGLAASTTVSDVDIIKTADYPSTQAGTGIGMGLYYDYGTLVVRNLNYSSTVTQSTRGGSAVQVIAGAWDRDGDGTADPLEYGAIRNITVDGLNYDVDVSRDDTGDYYYYPLVYTTVYGWDDNGDGTVELPKHTLHDLRYSGTVDEIGGITAIRPIIVGYSGDIDIADVQMSLTTNSNNEVSGAHLGSVSASELQGSIRNYRADIVGPNLVTKIPFSVYNTATIRNRLTFENLTFPTGFVHALATKHRDKVVLAGSHTNEYLDEDAMTFGVTANGPQITDAVPEGATTHRQHLLLGNPVNRFMQFSADSAGIGYTCHYCWNNPATTNWEIPYTGSIGPSRWTWSWNGALTYDMTAQQARTAGDNIGSQFFQAFEITPFDATGDGTSDLAKVTIGPDATSGIFNVNGPATYSNVPAVYLQGAVQSGDWTPFLWLNSGARLGFWIDNNAASAITTNAKWDAATNLWEAVSTATYGATKTETNYFGGWSKFSHQPVAAQTSGADWAANTWVDDLYIDNDGTAASTRIRIGDTTRPGDQGIELAPAKKLCFEGTTDNGNETCITVTDPTADRTITLPNDSGTVALTTLAGGGTNQTSWTASRCVQVSSDGTKLESASAACGSGGSGDMAKSVYDADGDGTVDVSATLLPTAALQVQYHDYDSDLDGTVDYRVCGDYDGDTTLEITDIESCIEAKLAARMSFFILPGTYTGGFRTEITIDEDYVTIRGAGREATYIDITGDASGDANALDDGDTTHEIRYLFRVGASHVTISDLSIDGGSTRWQNSQIDTDQDGTPNCQAQFTAATCTSGNPEGTGADGAACDNTDYCCCDAHDPIYVAVDESDVTIERVSITNGDRVFIGGYPGNPAAGRLRVRDMYGNGAGEHGIAAHLDHVSVSGSHFENCGGSDCILLPVPTATGSVDARITDNTFQDWGFSAISTEATTWAMGNLTDIVIANNTFRSTAGATRLTNCGVDIVGVPEQDGGGTYFSPINVSIVNNTFDLTDAAAAGIYWGAAAPADTETQVANISGNTIKMAQSARTLSTTWAGILLAGDHAVVSNNLIDITNASTSQPAAGIDLYYDSAKVKGARYVTLDANEIILRDDVGYGILSYGDDVTMTGNHIVSLDSALGSANENVGVYLAKVGSDTAGNVVVRDTTVRGKVSTGVYLTSVSDVVIDGLDCYDIEADGTAQYASCVRAFTPIAPLTVRDVMKSGGGYLAQSDSTTGVGTWDNLQCYGTCTCSGTAGRCLAGSGLDIEITADPDLTGPALKPWERVEEFYDCTGLVISDERASNFSLTGTYASDADPLGAASAQGVCSSATGTSAGSDSVLVIHAGSALTASSVATVQAGKMQHVRVRLRPTAAFGGSAPTRTAGRKVVGGFLVGTNADSSTFTNAAMFYACPTCDVDGDGTKGDADADGICAEAGEDSDDCNWWTVTGTGLTWGCLTPSNVSTDCDGDGTAEDEIAGTVTYADSEVSTITSNMQTLELKCTTWDTSGRCTGITYYIDGTAIGSEHTTGVPTTTKIWGWAVWGENITTVQQNEHVDSIYYLGQP